MLILTLEILIWQNLDFKNHKKLYLVVVKKDPYRVQRAPKSAKIHHPAENRKESGNRLIQWPYSTIQGAWKNAGHNMAIVGEQYNVDAHAKIIGLFLNIFCAFFYFILSYLKMLFYLIKFNLISYNYISIYFLLFSSI